MTDVLPFLHPVLGMVALLATIQLGAAGLQARQGRQGAHAKRKRHARQGPYVAAAMGVAALTGLASVVWLRSDLEPSASWHFWMGWAATVCMAGLAWATPRRFRRNAWVRNGHPAVGVAAMLAGVVAFILGIELLP